ncbi:MAG: PEP/pyruvate-binding domain-containing protein [Pseudonocardia sp.]
MTGPRIVPIDRAGDAGADRLGGKGASLARLCAAGLRVPPGFVVTTPAYRHAVLGAIGDALDAALADVPPDAPADELDAAAAGVRALVAAVDPDAALADEIRAAYDALGGADAGVAVAVRSSSAAEDSAEHSFAGEHDTYLWVCGADEVLARVRDCWASLFTTRAMEYRRAAGLAAAGDAMAVVVQEMVPARAAGVFMTLNPENGDRSKVAVESVWGLGEPLVSGAVTPDGFHLDKVTGEVVHRSVVDKPTELVRAPHGVGTATADVAADRRRSPSLTDGELAELLRLARLVERHFGCPQDGEFAIGPGSAPDNVYLVQSRPETVWSRRAVTKASTGASLMDSILSHLVPKRDTT